MLRRPRISGSLLSAILVREPLDIDNHSGYFRQNLSPFYVHLTNDLQEMSSVIVIKIVAFNLLPIKSPIVLVSGGFRFRKTVVLVYAELFRKNCGDVNEIDDAPCPPESLPKIFINNCSQHVRIDFLKILKKLLICRVKKSDNIKTDTTQSQFINNNDIDRQEHAKIHPQCRVSPLGYYVKRKVLLLAPNGCATDKEDARKN